MFSFLNKRSGPPGLDQFPLSKYNLNFNLEQIVPGVDNVRHDVLLSPAFCEVANTIVPQAIARNVELHEFFPIDKPVIWNKKVANFKEHYRQVIKEAVYRSKLENIPQIDHLAQIAVMKMLIREIRNQFEKTTAKIKNIIRKDKLSDRDPTESTAKIKESLSNVLQKKDLFLRKVGLQIFAIMLEVNKGELNTIREANFGVDKLLPDDILENPIFHTLNPYHDAFLIDEYDIIFGRRIEDPDNYDNLIQLLENLFRIISERKSPPKKLRDQSTGQSEIQNDKIDISKYLRHVQNMKTLVDYFGTIEKIRKRKKQASGNDDVRTLKIHSSNQKAILKEFYRTFSKARLIHRIAASYEMRTVYQIYCPPLVPQQILLYMIESKSRRTVKARLKQIKKIYNRPFSLSPLKRQIKKLDLLRPVDKKKYLTRFLNGLVHYHRDIENYKVISDSMERINLATDRKILHLSRANNTLYEFLLANEKQEDEKPIINHVIIKADVRGSTDITHQMKKRGLNPASYFSLNFFNPISEILKNYGAVKVFIEGDAIILSIFEHEKTPEGWYAVARACGIAMNMLIIINRYNEKSKKTKLPILELGIGVNYLDSSPTFLFDGDQRIMISSAINIADRQSSCFKPLRKALSQENPTFNLYVYQTVSEEAIRKTSDDIFLRYNVNGIELNPDGFEKLGQEINLTTLKITIPELKRKSIKLYTGKFPLTTGRFQRLIIRESRVRQLRADTLQAVKTTNRKYYEVCTHPLVYRYVRKKMKLTDQRLRAGLTQTG